jgi:hypothetical protein
MRLATVAGLVVLVLAAVAPASAEEPSETLDLAALAAAPVATPAVAPAPPAGRCGWPDLAPALVPDPIEAAVSGSCTATCWDTTARTCTGSSCSAVDSDCPDEQGYCWSNAEGFKYCQTCPAGDCGSDGQMCFSNLDCGYCMGYQCICRTFGTKKHCVCP